MRGKSALNMRGLPARSSEFSDASLYGRGMWPQFQQSYDGVSRLPFSRDARTNAAPGIPANYAAFAHQVVRPKFMNIPQGFIDLGNMPYTYGDYRRTTPAGGAGNVPAIAAALRNSATALFNSSTKGS